VNKTFFAVATATVIAVCATLYNNRNADPVIVKINFGSNSKIDTVAYKKTLNAFEALTQIASVDTCIQGNFSILTSIDNVDTENGKYLWLYKINGKLKNSLAVNQLLNEGDTVTWELVRYSQCLK